MASNTAQVAQERKDESKRTGIPLVLARGPAGREEAKREQEGFACTSATVSSLCAKGRCGHWHTAGTREICRDHMCASSP